MQYTEFTEKDKEYLDNICTPTDRVLLSETRKDTTYFSFHSLGLKPRLWQSKFWRKLDGSHKRIVVVTSRQIGKSIADAVFALKAAAYNIRPAGFNKKTHVGIISASDEQSKKIILEIRRLMEMGDEQVARQTGGKIQKFYTSMIDTSLNASNNKTAITFKNGNMIMCLPPTPRIKGYSFSYVFVDEAALDAIDETVFFEYIEPTTSQTDGVIILTSTPNGQQGWFYELFDPEDKKDFNPYERMWVHYSVVEDPDFQDMMAIKKQEFYASGREKKFQQEYDALFTSQESSFFENEDVEKGISKDLARMESCKDPCDVGLDFGMVHANTVITVSRILDKDHAFLIYDYEYKEKDDTLFEDLVALRKKFNVRKFNVDDCPEGHYVIQEMERIGWPVTKMNFKSEKVEKYHLFRAKLKQGKIRYYRNNELIAQMKALQQIEGPTSTKIQKPPGGRDDYPDSFLLSLYHFLEDDGDLRSGLIGIPNAVKKDKGVRHDGQFEALQLQGGLVDMEELKMWGEIL